MTILSHLPTLSVQKLSPNLIEQAEHLFNSGYHLAAGVIGRAILEEHLRTTCETIGCLPAKPRATINDFNQALYGAQHYTKIKMKQIETLTTIGNDAAHKCAHAKCCGC